MAKDSNVCLRSKVMYSIYVRNHTKEGNFNGVTKDLDRIKELGADIIWLMPIHPIGQVNKKGELGCPYSIEDYRKVNPEYGTLQDFKNLIKETHRKGMQLIIDVVYNHTSHNSVLLREHPEWFFRKADGSTGNKVGDWTDIIDLDYNNMGLWNYQIETLKYWISLGVDGFRCDVGSLIPVEFWLKAREEVKKLNKDAFWLCESVDPGFVSYLRENGVLCHSDSEIYQAFDITYEYDTYRTFTGYLEGKYTLEQYIEKKREQEYIFPENYIKLRFVENHDNPRSAYLFPEEIDLKNWTAFSFFEKGMPLVYAGQEARDNNLPSLFDKDFVNWDRDKKYVNFIKKLISIKKKDIFTYGKYSILKAHKFGVIQAQYVYDDVKLTGLFNVERKIGEYEIGLQDGNYTNLIDDSIIEVRDGKVKLNNNPVIIEE